VTAAFELYSQTDPNTQGLYQAARQQSPISVMFQLGESQGQLVGGLFTERDSGGAGIRRQQEPAAMEIPIVEGAGNGEQRNRGGVCLGGLRSMIYKSVATVESRVVERRDISRWRKCRSEGRAELMRQVRELARRMEFLEAGQDAGRRWMRRCYE
jgi:hypothetical protein